MIVPHVYRIKVLKKFIKKENKTMFIFISVPMKDKTDEEINKEIEFCKNAYLNIVKAIDVNCKITFVDNHIPYSNLGKAITKLIQCDACIFLEGYEEYRGCRIEHNVCEEYNIPTFIAGGEDNYSYIEREMPEEKNNDDDMTLITSYNNDDFSVKQREIVNKLIEQAFEAGRKMNS